MFDKAFALFKEVAERDLGIGLELYLGTGFLFSVLSFRMGLLGTILVFVGVGATAVFVVSGLKKLCYSSLYGDEAYLYGPLPISAAVAVTTRVVIVAFYIFLLVLVTFLWAGMLGTSISKVFITVFSEAGVTMGQMPAVAVITVWDIAVGALLTAGTIQLGLVCAGSVYPERFRAAARTAVFAGVLALFGGMQYGISVLSGLVFQNGFALLLIIFSLLAKMALAAAAIYIAKTLLERRYQPA